MGKIVTIVDGKESQVVYEAGMGGLNEFDEAGHHLIFFYKIPTVHGSAHLEIEKDPDTDKVKKFKLDLDEDTEGSIGNLTGFSVRHLKG